ncbi:RluA family pseudouridine synthase [bacterium]|nr:RluA family pseudouridine synthase [bacterium]
MFPLDIIYQDNHLLVVNKPAGVLIQGDKSGDKSLYHHVQHYLKTTLNKPGNVYLGLVHRLDRPVSGVVVFAKTSKAASRLSEQFRKKTIKKSYIALVKGKIPTSGTLVDQIERMGVTSRIVTDGTGKDAKLSYRRLLYQKEISLVEIQLETGRHHQIRIQFSNLGFPILGDFRYGSKEKFPLKAIALHAHSLQITHPTTKESMIFSSNPSELWPLVP